jgi:hypothetical protein
MNRLSVNPVDSIVKHRVNEIIERKEHANESPDDGTF